MSHAAVLPVPSRFRALLARVRPHRRTLLVAGGLGLLGSAGGLAQPLAAREVIEALAARTSLLDPLLLLGALVLASAVIAAVSLWLLERTSERIVLGARRELTRRLLRLRLSAFDHLAPGDLVARATSDSTLLGSVSSLALVQLVNGAVTIVGAVVFMAIVDVILLGVTVAVLALVGVAVGFVMPRILRATERQQAAVGALGAALDRAASWSSSRSSRCSASAARGWRTAP